MADMKIEYEQVLARRKGQPPLPTAVVYPCNEDALIGAVDAAKARADCAAPGRTERADRQGCGKSEG